MPRKDKTPLKIQNFTRMETSSFDTRIFTGIAQLFKENNDKEERVKQNFFNLW